MLNSSLNSKISSDWIADCNTPPSIISRYGFETLNSPYKQGITGSTNGTLITSTFGNQGTSYSAYKYYQQIALSDGSRNIFVRWKANTDTYTSWDYLSPEVLVKQIVLSFSNGTAYYNFNSDVYVISAVAIGTMWPCVVCRTSGRSGYGFSLVSNGGPTVTAQVYVEVFYRKI